VRETGTGALVGTYRLQTGTSAKAHHDYYSAGEFDLSPLEPYRAQIVELGRACVHKAHRNVRVLSMLWRGIGNYLALKHARYVLGCSSLDSQNTAEGVAVYRHLQEKHLAPSHFRVEPWTDYACHSTEVWTAEPKVPGLLAAYFSLGAYICGSPALDREFGTIDFLTVLDMQRLNPRAAALYLGPEWKQIHAAFSESSPSPA
jgi:putative hemolysin